MKKVSDDPIYISLRANQGEPTNPPLSVKIIAGISFIFVYLLSFIFRTPPAELTAAERLVVLWWREYIPGTWEPTRELGFDSQSRLILALPYGREYTWSTDSIQDVQWCNEKFEYISKEQFEEIWDKKEQLLPAASKSF